MYHWHFSTLSVLVSCVLCIWHVSEPTVQWQWQSSVSRQRRPETSCWFEFLLVPSSQARPGPVAWIQLFDGQTHWLLSPVIRHGSMFTGRIFMDVSVLYTTHQKLFIFMVHWMPDQWLEPLHSFYVGIYIFGLDFPLGIQTLVPALWWIC